MTMTETTATAVVETIVPADLRNRLTEAEAKIRALTESIRDDVEAAIELVVESDRHARAISDAADEAGIQRAGSDLWEYTTKATGQNDLFDALASLHELCDADAALVDDVRDGRHEVEQSSENGAGLAPVDA